MNKRLSHLAVLCRTLDSEDDPLLPELPPEVLPCDVDIVLPGERRKALVLLGLIDVQLSPVPCRCRPLHRAKDQRLALEWPVDTLEVTSERRTGDITVRRALREPCRTPRRDEMA